MGKNNGKTLLRVKFEITQGIPGTPSASEAHREEAQAWLKSTLQEIIESLGLHWRGEGETVSRDMMEFVGFAQQAVYRGMERELAAVERKNAKHREKVSSSS